MSTLLQETELKHIKQQCEWAQDEIVWKNDAPITAARTIKSALQAAVDGLDIGRERTLLLMPKTADYHVWMDYAHLLTIYYNRNRTVQRYTILRMGLLLHTLLLQL